MKRLLLGLLLFALALSAQARLMRIWTYQELFDKADLVVIAIPVSTQDTTERSTLADVSPAIPVIWLSTQFNVSLVMKGDKALGHLVMHHYRELEQKATLGGPSLVTFDPTHKPRYLLFLRREPDGRYAPVSGQTDPADTSAMKLQGPAR